MARKPMVTRTITSTRATILCLDTISAEPYNETVSLSGTYKDNKTILKAAKEIIEQDENKTACKVVDVAIQEKLYGMTEQDFLHYAKELPPRKEKPSESPNQEA